MDVKVFGKLNQIMCKIFIYGEFWCIQNKPSDVCILLYNLTSLKENPNDFVVLV